MNLIERTRSWWATRNQPRKFGPIRCSIHVGADLRAILRYTVREEDLLKVVVNPGGTVVAASLEMPADSPCGYRIMHSALDDGETSFLRITFAGAEQWLRMQEWTRHTSGQLVANFSRQYQSRRWNPTFGFHVEDLIEPSPPVPFDERHPHYAGSAQCETNRRRREGQS